VVVGDWRSEPEATVLRHATSLIVDDGHSTWTAAEVLNGLGLTPRKAPRWVHNRLRKVLLSPVIGGRWSYSSAGGEIEMQIPAVLDAERHAALLDALRASSTGPRRADRERQYLLSRGILHGMCGAPLHGIWRKDRASRVYRCAGARPEARPRCADHAVNADQVEEAVWAEVVGLLSEPKRLLQMAEDYLGLRSVEAGTQLEQLATIDEKLATLKQARTGRVAHALRAGVDAAVLKSAVDELEAQERCCSRTEPGTRSGAERRRLTPTGCGDSRAWPPRLVSVSAGWLRESGGPCSSSSTFE